MSVANTVTNKRTLSTKHLSTLVNQVPLQALLDGYEATSHWALQPFSARVVAPPLLSPNLTKYQYQKNNRDVELSRYLRVQL
jgi:hypothetical protein